MVATAPIRPRSAQSVPLITNPAPPSYSRGLYDHLADTAEPDTTISFLRVIAPWSGPDDPRSNDEFKFVIISKAEGWPGRLVMFTRAQLHQMNMLDLGDTSDSDAYWVSHGYVRAKIDSTKQDAVELFDTAWVECDDKLTANDFSPPPTFAVCTSPGRHHFYWRLAVPVSADEIEALNRRLAYGKLYQDKAGWAVTKLLRVPATTNYKYETPTHVEIVVSEPSRIYQSSDFDGLPDVSDFLPIDIPELPLSIDRLDRVAVIATHGKRKLYTILHRLDNPGADRSGALFWVGCEAFRQGLRLEEAYALAEGTNADKFHAKRRYNADRDLWRTIRDGFARAQEAPPDDDKAATNFQSYTRSQLRTITPPKYLVPGLVIDNAVNGISGAEGTYKSFLMLSAMCSVNTGVPWFGREILRTGPVIYLAAEGAEGINQRITAWEQFHDATVGDDFIVIGEGPNFLEDRDVDMVLEDIVTRLGDVQPMGFVADTLSQTMDGDENANQNMRTYVKSLDRIRRETGAACSFLHHDSDAGKVMRGGSALRGNVHGIVNVTINGDIMTATVKKAKDFAKPAPMSFRPQPVEGTESIILVPVSSRTAPFAIFNAQQKVALDALSSFGDTHPTATKWQEEAARQGLNRTDFFPVKQSLIATGAVAIHGEEGKRGTTFSVVMQA